MEANKTIKEALNIEKPQEWVDAQCTICHEKGKEDSEVFDTILGQALIERGHLPFLMSVKLNGNEEALTDIVSLFYTIGFMRGKIDQEGIDQLGKVWGKK